ncbi:MAG: integrase core domain-containing protein [Caldilineaceae bacterium]
MARRTSLPEREAFVTEHQAGSTYAVIAGKYGVSADCVRYWCRRARRSASLTSAWRRRGPALRQDFDPLVRYVILRLRLKHPGWGPSRIRHHLGKRSSLQGQRLPSATQIGRYLHQWVRFRRQRRRPVPPVPRSQAPPRVHECWQVDFKLGIVLADGVLGNLHTVHDPVGEVCITLRMTEAGRVGQKPRRVSLPELQTTLRSGFARWQTLPEEVQTDNEALFVGNRTEQFPSRFALWLIGLGIRHRLIRPSKPTDNASVERNHRTVCDYALRGHEHDTLAQLHPVLDEAWPDLAFELSSQAKGCVGQPPVVAHPDLLHPVRPYQPAQEFALFDLQRVDHFLAQFTWQRIVGKTGQVSLGGQHHYYSVGHAYAAKAVVVRFDPTDRHFVFALADTPHQVIARRPARNLDASDLIGEDFRPHQLALPLKDEKG